MQFADASQDRTRTSPRRFEISRATVARRSAALAAGACALGLAMPTPAHAALSAVSPVLEAASGLPIWYQDGNGLTLAPCDDGSAPCVGVTPDVIASGDTAAEVFYNRAVATVNGPVITGGGGKPAKLIQTLSLQAGNGAAGQRIVFQRIRTRIVGGAPSSRYTVVEPFGTQVIDTGTSGTGTTAGQDLGCLATTTAICAFDTALPTPSVTSPDGTVGPFLQWSGGTAPPVGYVGDGATAHTFIGSPPFTNGNPAGTNFFSMTGPGLANGNPATTGTIQTSTYVITGKISPAPVASAALAPTSLTFSATTGATSPAKTVTVTNNGTAPLTISAITAGAPFAVGAETCSAAPVAAGGGTCTIDVTFTAPATAGSSTGTLSFTDNTSAGTHSVGLSGTAVAPAPVVALSATTLPFGNQPITTTSAAQTLTISNTGNADLSISSIAVTPAGAQFATSADTCTGVAVVAGSSCTINVQFSPTSTGAKTASLAITDNAGNHSVALTGTGTAPAVTLTPTSLAFGSQPVGTTSAGLTVSVQNSGNAPLNVSAVGFGGTNPGDYIKSADSCSPPASSVGPGLSCSIQVRFGPGTKGASTASLTITDNAGNHSVPLSGTGAAPAVLMTPSSVAFGSQLTGTSSAISHVVIQNTGDAPLAIGTVTIAGANPGDFGKPADGCAASSVAAGASCTIAVQFTPTAAGARSGTIAIADNAGNHTVVLSGTGAVAPIATVSPASIAFGNGSVGATSAAQTVTITNTGNATLTFSAITLTGANAADFVKGAGCAASVAPNTSCTVPVSFKPGTTGFKSASLTITDNAGTQTVALGGTGVQPAMLLSPTSIAFGTVRNGAASLPQTVTVKNTGGANMVISAVALTGANANQFTLTNSCAGAAATVVPAGSCTLTVKFTPNGFLNSGAKTASVSITDNAPGSPHAVTLSGTASAF